MTSMQPVYDEIKKSTSLINTLESFTKQTYDNLFVTTEYQMTIKHKELEDLLKNKEYISSFNNLVKTILVTFKEKYSYLDDIKGKKILLAWMYVSFPKIVLDIDEKFMETNKQDIQTQIYISSSNLINLINDIISNKLIEENTFHKILSEYLSTFKKYIDDDKNKMIYNMKTEWFNISDNMENILRSDIYDNDQKKDLFIEMNRTRKKTLFYLSTIDNTITESTLKDEYKTLKTLKKISVDIEKELFLNLIIEKKYDILKKYINYIKEYFINISKTIEYDINSYVDSDFIIQQIEFLNIEQIGGYGNFFVKILHKICASSQDKYIDDGWKKLRSTFLDNDQENNNIKFLIELIFFILHNLDFIYNTILEFREMISMDINPFDINYQKKKTINCN